MNKAEERYVTLIEQLSKYLRGIKVRETIPLGDYEGTYKKLRGLKGFYDGAPWDRIQKDIGSDWLKKVRSDEQFKEYYRIRVEIDKLEVLV